MESIYREPGRAPLVTLPFDTTRSKMEIDYYYRTVFWILIHRERCPRALERRHGGPFRRENSGGVERTRERQRRRPRLRWPWQTLEAAVAASLNRKSKSAPPPEETFKRIHAAAAAAFASAAICTAASAALVATAAAAAVRLAKSGQPRDVVHEARDGKGRAARRVHRTGQLAGHWRCH